MERRELPSLPARYSSRWVEDRLEIAHSWRRSWGLMLLSPALLAAVGLAIGHLVGWEWQHSERFLQLTALGILALYPGLVFLLNRTRFTFDRAGMRIRHGPLPIRRGGFFRRSDLHALHLENHGTGEPSWYLAAELLSGRRLYVVEGARSFEEASRIASVVREHLGIDTGMTEELVPLIVPKAEEKVSG